MNELLTWNDTAKFIRVAIDEAILQCPPPNTLGADEHQSFPLKRWHPRDFLVQQQFCLIEVTVAFRLINNLFLFLRYSRPTYAYLQHKRYKKETILTSKSVPCGHNLLRGPRKLYVSLPILVMV